MTNRKFYKYTVTLEFLSETPIPTNVPIEDIVYEAVSGDYSMRRLDENAEELNGLQAAMGLVAQDSDPGFFRLTEDGEDSEEIA
jgi:hypothetical protein